MASPSASLNKLAVHGAFWTILGYGAANSLRFAGNLILTRLLAPELFGLMALMTTFLVGVSLFSDVGIEPSIIQNQRGKDPKFLNTAWTIQAIRGVGLWAICCIIAYPISRYYNDPRIFVLMPVVGLSSLVSGLNSTSIALNKREMNLKVLIGIDFLQQIVSLVVIVIWAYFYPSVWALVIGGLTGNILKLLISHFYLKGPRNNFAWDPTCAREIFRFGRWIFLSTAFTFLAMQSDRLIIGKIVSLEMLGIYSICIALSDMPRQIVTMLGHNVIFPVVSKAKDSTRTELSQKFFKKRWILLFGAMGFATLLVSGGDLLVEFLYDSRYSQEAWILTILAFGFWHTVLYETMNSCLMGLGKPYYATIGFILRFIVLLIGVPAAYHVGGFVAAVFVIAFHDLPMYAVISYGAIREKVSSVKQDILATILFLSVLAVAIFLRFLLGFGYPLQNIL